MFKTSIFFRSLSFLTTFVFLVTTICPASYAQSALNLPVPGTLVGPSESFVPVLLKGLKLHPEDPLTFTFIVDEGQDVQDNQTTQQEAERLVKYFMAALTVPSGDFWVNLSPIEPDRIIPGPLSQTLLGRDMLAQDYILKQLTATLMHPEEELGKKFWDRIYSEVQQKYGISDIPMNTFNKVWIMPESASIYEEGNSVVVTGGRLKVMMEGDYAMTQNSVLGDQQQSELPSPQALPSRGQAGDSRLSSQRTLGPSVFQNDLTSNDTGSRVKPGMTEDVKTIIREVILPAITQEVNEGKNFAPLRQIYYSLILAKWYKQKVKGSLMGEMYVDQNKVSGINDVTAQEKSDIYNRYVEAYQKGVFSLIKEDYDPAAGEILPKKYFSGGVTDNASMVLQNNGVPSFENPFEMTVTAGKNDFAMMQNPAKDNVKYVVHGSPKTHLILDAQGTLFSSDNHFDAQDLENQWASPHIQYAVYKIEQQQIRSNEEIFSDFSLQMLGLNRDQLFALGQEFKDYHYNFYKEGDFGKETTFQREHEQDWDLMWKVIRQVERKFSQEAKEWQNDYRENWFKENSADLFFPNMLEMLRLLNGRDRSLVKVSLVSQSSKNIMEAILKGAGLEGVFDEIVEESGPKINAISRLSQDNVAGSLVMGDMWPFELADAQKLGIDILPVWGGGVQRANVKNFGDNPGLFKMEITPNGLQVMVEENFPIRTSTNAAMLSLGPNNERFKLSFGHSWITHVDKFGEVINKRELVGEELNKLTGFEELSYAEQYEVFYKRELPAISDANRPSVQDLSKRGLTGPANVVDWELEGKYYGFYFKNVDKGVDETVIVEEGKEGSLQARVFRGDMVKVINDSIENPILWVENFRKNPDRLTLNVKTLAELGEKDLINAVVANAAMLTTEKAAEIAAEYILKMKKIKGLGGASLNEENQVFEILLSQDLKYAVVSTNPVKVDKNEMSVDFDYKNVVEIPAEIYVIHFDRIPGFDLTNISGNAEQDSDYLFNLMISDLNILLDTGHVVKRIEYDHDTFGGEPLHLSWNGSDVMASNGATSMKVSVDKAAMADVNGGIDMNEIGMDSQGSTTAIQFDPAAVQRILQSPPQTFSPVTVNFQSTAKPLEVLGMKPAN